MFPNRIWYSVARMIGTVGLTVLLGHPSDRLVAAPPPNLVFILADDMGWGDVSRYACTDYVTPNLDRIGQAGVTLTRAYAWPVCSPSRAALLTGMDPKRVGVPAVLLPGATGIHTNSYTLAEHLRRQGYATALVGKWHLGYSNNALPQARGFDTCFGHHGGEINYTSYYYTSGAEYDLYDGVTNVAADYQGQYSTRVFTDKAKQFIDAHTNQPFFLYLAYNAPHYPLYAPTNYTARFTHIPFGARRTFAAMVGAMDDGVGEILDLLAARGLTSNTLVWFMTDNGAMTGQGGVNLPLRGEKYMLNEGGVRVPAMVQWPGHLPAGVTNDALFRVTDVFPTVSAAAGLAVPPSLALDGTNQWPVLQGEPASTPRALVFFDDGSYAQRSLITAEWKYIRTNGTPELYALPGDVAEATNQAAAQPDLTAQFETAITGVWQSITSGLYLSHTQQPPSLLKAQRTGL